MIFLFKATITRNRSKVLEKPSGVTHDYNPNTHEAEAEGSWIMNQIAWPKSTILPQKEPGGGAGEKAQQEEHWLVVLRNLLQIQAPTWQLTNT